MLRYEFKYYVPENKLELLRKMLRPFTYLDAFADSQPKKEYTVRSIYFDTPDFECYHTKVEGIKNRLKVRLRGYNTGDEKSTVFLELKKKYENPLLKQRAKITYKQAKKLFLNGEINNINVLEDVSEQARENTSRFYYQLLSRKMRPVVLVVYEREPYLGLVDIPENKLRITIDKNLRSTAYPKIKELYTNERVVSVMRNHFILEIKYNKRFPAFMRPVIQTLGLKKEPASKYCLSIDRQNRIDPYSRFDTFTFGRFFDSRRK